MRYLICLLLVGCTTRTDIRKDIAYERAEIDKQLDSLQEQLRYFRQDLRYLEMRYSCHNRYALVCYEAATADYKFDRVILADTDCKCRFKGNDEDLELDPEYAKAVLASKCKEAE